MRRPADGEVLIELLDNHPDSFGRTAYTIAWPDNNQWRGGDGVSAQVQHSNLDDAMTRWHDNRPGDRFVIYDEGDRL